MSLPGCIKASTLVASVTVVKVASPKLLSPVTMTSYRQKESLLQSCMREVLGVRVNTGS